MRKALIKTTLLAGTLDISAACFQAYLTKGTTPGSVLQFIASGLFGKAAFAGGYGMMAMGLLFHFLIVFACATIFFIVYPMAKFLHWSIIVNSLLIALVAWVVTTRIVLPLSAIKTGVFSVDKAAIAIAILFVCVGLPISIAAKQYKERKLL